MNRKGAEGGLTTNELVFAIIAGVVLVVVGGFVYYFATGGAIPFANLIPGFNVSGEKVEGIAIIRYDIANDKIEYYDRTQWKSFEGKSIELGEIRVDYASAREKFVNYFFGERISSDIQKDGLHLIVIMNIGNVPPPKGKLEEFFYFWYEIDYEPYKSGNLIIRNQLADGKYEMYYLDINNDIYYDTGYGNFVKDGGKTRRVTALKIKTILIEWRDSIISKPIELKYTDIASGNEITGKYCIRKINYERDKDLVVDLEGDITTSEIC